MSSLQAYIDLKKLVQETNKSVIENKIISHGKSNFLFIASNQGTIQVEMESFTNDFVLTKLKEQSSATSIVLTDLAAMQVGEKELTYFLYKCYHRELEQGLVYYQPVNKETLAPEGDIQFSNQEDNIFFKVIMPDFEESSCNAIEAKESTAENKRIAFLIGNMNEERLLFDIERLVITTMHNCMKHQKLNFEFIVSIAKYGDDFSDKFDPQLQSIKQLSQTVLAPFPTVTFSFEYAE